jgi:hypothetical protein
MQPTLLVLERVRLILPVYLVSVIVVFLVSVEPLLRRTGPASAQRGAHKQKERVLGRRAMGAEMTNTL